MSKLFPLRVPAWPLPALPTSSALALPCLFVLFGFLIGSWAARIPALRDGLAITHAMLSMVLLCGGLGAVISYPVTTRLMAAFGARHTMLTSGLALVAAVLCIGSASNVVMLMLAVLLLGLAASCFDVAVNALATEKETSSGKAGLSLLHAWFCVGSLAGAGLASLMGARGISPQIHFALLALPAVGVLLLAHAQVLEGRIAQAGIAKAFAMPRGSVAMLGAIGFLGAMAEGSVVDWSGVFLKDHFLASDAMTPLALSAFNLLMLSARLVGDRIKTRFGARRPLAGGALLSAAGLLGAVLAPDVYYALVGFALSGAGLAFVFPYVFSAAGREGQLALSGIATMTYTGSLMGPPLMGALAQGLGIQAAIALIAMLSVCIAIAALRAKSLEARPH